MPSIYEGGRRAPRSPLSGRFFYSGVEGEGLYDLFDLLLNLFDLLFSVWKFRRYVPWRQL